MQKPLATMVVELVFLVALCTATLGMLLVAPASADDASEHFEAAARAFKEQRFADAAVEFESAYRIQPHYQVLYNLGTVYAALGRPVESVDALERYIRPGGAEVQTERRAQVERELARQRSKLAHLRIAVGADGAEVRLDTVLIGFGPLRRTVALAQGRHVVEVAAAGFQPARAELSLEAGSTERWAPQLAPLPSIDPISDVAPSRSPGSAQRLVSYVIASTGLAATVAGVVVAARGQAQHFDAVDAAEADNWHRAERLEADADRKKTAGYVLLGTGGALFISGLVVLLTAPRPVAAGTHARISPWSSARAGGLLLEGQWQ